MIKKFFVLIALVGLLAGTSAVSQASEGGSSLYLMGTYNDFYMGVWGPPGIYLRNDVFLYSARVDATPLGGRLAAGVRQNVWGNVAKVALVTKWKVLGGNYGAAVSIPVVYNAHVFGNGRFGNLAAFRGGNVGGLGDIAVFPFEINWVFGENKYHHLTAAPGIRPPTGIYDRNRILNVGRNYWAFDNTVAYTWLNTKRGHEVSLNLGYILNTTNPATNYTTGNEFHMDWLAGQHFNERFAVGVTGYCYVQVTHDQGPLPFHLRPEKFDGRGVGLGAAVLYTPKVFGKDVNLIAKYIHDLWDKRRWQGDLYMISIALKML